MISGFVVGDDKVIGRFRLVNSRVMDEMRKATQIIGFRLAAYVQKNKLSGQVLKNRTGKLRRSITFVETDTSTDSTGGTVGTNTEYAAVHEYGFSGTVTVKEHLRMMTMAWGRSVTPREITVRSHPMKMNMPEKSFLRSSLKDNAGMIKDEYTKAQQRGLSGA